MKSKPAAGPFAGRYLFHLHTTYTDGQVTVGEYFELAQRLGMERLIFLEHIRAAPDYDVQQFAAEVRACVCTHALPALVGFEAKLLPGGALDIAPEHAALADVLGLAEHGFPADYDLWRSSLCTALERLSAAEPRGPVVWVHPGLWLKKHGLLESRRHEYAELVRHAQGLGILVERNLRYRLLPDDLLSAVRPDRLVLGADAHRPEEAAAAAHLAIGS